MAKRGGLGSGLGAIFGDEYVQSPVSTPADAEQNTDTLLPITKVEPRKDQPRYHFDEDALAELTDSIREYGLIQPITVRELGLLKEFAAHPGEVLSRDTLFDEVWGMDYAGGTRTLDQHIVQVRRKLGPSGDLIETVRGVGYRLRE